MDPSDLQHIGKLFRNAAFGFCVIDRNNRVVFCNRSLSRNTGLSKDAIEGIDFFDLFHDEVKTGELHDAALNNGIAYKCPLGGNDPEPGVFNVHFEGFGEDYKLVYFYDMSENERLRKNLMISEKRLSAAQKAADIGSWEYDFGTDLIYASEKANEIFGEIQGVREIGFDRILNLVVDKERIEKEFSDFLEGKKEYNTVYKINPADGSGQRVIYSTGNIFRDNDGKPLRAVGYIKDITPWIEMEEKVKYEEALLNTYLNFVGTIIIMLDENGCVTFINRKGSEVLGYESDELIGKNWIETVIPPEDSERVERIRRGILKAKSDRWAVVENGALAKDGSIRIIRWNNTTIKDETGKVTGTISSGEDITEIKQNESRLEESEASLKEAEEKARMGHWIRKPKEDYIFWSDGLYRMFGYNPGDVEPSLEKGLKFIHVDDREKYKENVKKAVDSGEGYTMNLRAYGKDGSMMHLKVEADVEKNNRGQTERIRGIVTDITETYERIRELEDSRKRLALSETMSHTGHWQRDLKTDTYIFSDELYRIFGIEEGVRLVRHNPLHERLHPDDRKRILALSEEKLKKGEDYTYKGRIIKPDGGITYFEAEVIVEKDSGGKPVKAYGIMRDVTELREHERKLEQNEMQLRRAEEIAGAGNWVMDIETGEYICSDNFYRICGFDPGSTETTFENIMGINHPEDMERVVSIIEESIEKGTDYEFENRIVLPDGSIKHVRSKGTYIKDKKGKPIKSVGTILDITEYKKAEERLIESRGKLEKAEEISHLGHWERDFRTGKSHWSDEIYRILGYEPQSFEASENKYREFLHPDDYDDFMTNSKLAHDGEIPYVIEARAYDKDGNLKYIRSRGNTIKENGVVVKTFGTLEDVTESRLREMELLEKNRMLDAAEAIAHVGHFINDHRDNKRYWSDEIYRIMGFEPGDELDILEWTKDNMDPEDYRDMDERLSDAIDKRKKTHETDMKIRDRFGNVKYLKMFYRFEYENKKPATTFGVVKDMTDIKTHYEDMEYMNYHDALTDLYNRRYFDEVFDDFDRKENYPLTIIVADINGLKITNDTMGHGAGDRLIMKAARILKSVIQQEDLLARIGGDDFILVMPRTTKSQAEMVMNVLYELYSKANEEIPISVSMGLAVKLKADKSKEELIKEAEDNMYSSKLYEKTSKSGDLLRLIMGTLYERSSREEKHSERVSKYCREIARALKMPEHKINELTALGLLHDIGKISIKDSVLNKPGRLNAEEWKEIKKHSETGYRILSQSPGMVQASEYVLAHHERWDGKGYPKGLKSYEIPLQARIIAVCDAFDAMISKRPYKEPMSTTEAITELKKGSGTQFDPDIAKVFVVNVLGEKW